MEKAKKIQILKDIINIKSVNGNEKAVADYLTKLFNEYGIETQQVAYDTNRDNLVVEIGTEGSKVLAFSGHMDSCFSFNTSVYPFIYSCKKNNKSSI